ncbi:NUT member 2G [Saguinus oedipus]|uniref:NUT member 2G n=1 Tax=Saguinus oedipus TaxID=9490 RepID=A0ABQ9TAE7_SAGOE|nr:NUT member 2G [Saguinus oedipus]
MQGGGAALTMAILLPSCLSVPSQQGRPQGTASETKAHLPPSRPQQAAETKAHLTPPRPQQAAETKAPEEIPPEVVQEYVDIMEELLGPPAGATGELEGQRQEGKVEQQGDEMLLDPGTLSYVDNLCSQKDFVTKVGWPEVLGSAGFHGVVLTGPWN